MNRFARTLFRRISLRATAKACSASRNRSRSLAALRAWMRMHRAPTRIFPPEQSSSKTPRSCIPHKKNCSSAFAAIVRSSLSICPRQAMHCSQSSPSGASQKQICPRREILRGTPISGSLRQPPALPPATRSMQVAAQTRTGHHKFSTAYAAANERTVFGVGTNCCMEK